MQLVQQKRQRRTKAQIGDLRKAIYAVAEAEKPCTCRQLFYALVSQGVIPKTEQAYRGVICRQVVQMRRENVLPWHWIADNTRWIRKPNSWDGLDSLLDDMQALYRRDIWRDQGTRVEIWLEKDALAGTVYPVTARYDVALMVTRGYASHSFLQSAAQEAAAADGPTYIYYFGDCDPSGRDIPKFVERTLREYAPDTELHFEVVAVLPEQIEQWGLPTRPTKRTDTRSKGWHGESVDLDAVPSSTLRELVEDCITRHIDPYVLSQTKEVEAAEISVLQDYTNRIRGDED